MDPEKWMVGRLLSFWEPWSLFRGYVCWSSDGVFSWQRSNFHDDSKSLHKNMVVLWNIHFKLVRCGVSQKHLKIHPGRLDMFHVNLQGLPAIPKRTRHFFQRSSFRGKLLVSGRVDLRSINLSIPGDSSRDLLIPYLEVTRHLSKRSRKKPSEEGHQQNCQV